MVTGMGDHTGACMHGIGTHTHTHTDMQTESSEGDWSSGMIPALGAGGRGFDSRITPSFAFSQ